MNQNLAQPKRSDNSRDVNDPSYRDQANEHAPRTLQEIQAAAHQLANDGYSDYGIAYALGLDVTAVRRLLGRCVGACE